jgi:hypothetical protein
MFEPDPPASRPHVTSLPPAPKSITLHGYIQSVADNSITLNVCNPATAWANLPREYFFRGVRRHVNAVRDSCTITITAKTSGRAPQSAYVKVIAIATPYKFWGDGSLIAGWNLHAISIKKIDLDGQLKK